MVHASVSLYKTTWRHCEEVRIELVVGSFLFRSCAHLDANFPAICFNFLKTSCLSHIGEMHIELCAYMQEIISIGLLSLMVSLADRQHEPAPKPLRKQTLERCPSLF
jgi:hypothetical protein